MTIVFDLQCYYNGISQKRNTYLNNQEGSVMKQKIFHWSVGVICAKAMMVGLVAIILPENASLAMSITVIVISIASGLILPNPFSFLGLIAGILMLFMPLWVVGIVLIALSITGMLLTPLHWRKTH